MLNRHNWHEPAAYASTLVCLSAGWLLGTNYDPDWMSRAGSVVICIGVLLAASRKVDRQEEAVAKHQVEHQNAMRPIVASALREVKGSEPTWTEVHMAEAEIASNVPDDLTPMFKKRRRLLRLHEVALVIGGTLVNGFGPWIVRSAA